MFKHKFTLISLILMTLLFITGCQSKNDQYITEIKATTDGAFTKVTGKVKADQGIKVTYTNAQGKEVKKDDLGNEINVIDNKNFSFYVLRKPNQSEINVTATTKAKKTSSKKVSSQKLVSMKNYSDFYKKVQKTNIESEKKRFPEHVKKPITVKSGKDSTTIDVNNGKIYSIDYSVNLVDLSDVFQHAADLKKPESAAYKKYLKSDYYRNLIVFNNVCSYLSFPGAPQIEDTDSVVSDLVGNPYKVLTTENKGFIFSFSLDNSTKQFHMIITKK